MENPKDQGQDPTQTPSDLQNSKEGDASLKPSEKPAPAPKPEPAPKPAPAPAPKPAPAPNAASAPKPAAPTPPPAPPVIENEKPKFADKTFAELPTTAMLCIEVETESFGTDKYTSRPQTEVKDNYMYQTKAYWLAVEKDDKGVPRYMRAKLLGLAIKNEETGQYDGYLPFYDRSLL